jgi:hypothetical protein
MSQEPPGSAHERQTSRIGLVIIISLEHKTDKPEILHWPSFGVAFAFMGLVGTFAGMSVSDFISEFSRF